MIRAIWNGTVLAEAPRTVRVEGNHYFPPESLRLRREYFVDSPTKSVCPWKGVARYYTVMVDGQPNTNAAWYYPKPSTSAANQGSRRVLERHRGRGRAGGSRPQVG